MVKFIRFIIITLITLTMKIYIIILFTTSYDGSLQVRIGVKVFVEFSMKVLGQNSDIGEQGPEHVEFLAEQFYPLLEPFILFDQQFNLLLGLAATDLCLFPALAYSYVVPFPSTLVLVCVLIHRLIATRTRLPVVVMMGLQVRTATAARHR